MPEPLTMEYIQRLLQRVNNTLNQINTNVNTMKQDLDTLKQDVRILKEKASTGLQPGGITTTGTSIQPRSVVVPLAQKRPEYRLIAAKPPASSKNPIHQSVFTPHLINQKLTKSTKIEPTKRKKSCNYCLEKLEALETGIVSKKRRLELKNSLYEVEPFCNGGMRKELCSVKREKELLEKTHNKE